MNTINMRSRADLAKGQGVLSAYREQVELVEQELGDLFHVRVNRPGFGDVTHYHTINLGYFLTLPVAKLMGKTVGYVHFLPETLEGSIRLPGFIKPIFYRYVLRFYKSMDYLVTVNPCFIDKLAALGVPREKITYIPNFVDGRQFHPLDAQEKRAARRRFGLDPDRFTVVCAGQLQARKGVFDFAELARRMPRVQFAWAGDFSFGRMSEGHDEIAALKKDPPENLRFLGMIEREDMCAFYNTGDVMLLPSYSELFPMTVLEAMSCNVPLLLRDLDIYPDILGGYYLGAGDNDGFQAALERLMTDRPFYENAVGRSRRGDAFYSREHVAQMWRSFYLEALYGDKLPEQTAMAIKRLVNP